MAESNAKSTLVVVGLIAFFIGRCSVAPDPAPARSSPVSDAGNNAPIAARTLLSSAEPTSAPPTRAETTETTVNPWTSALEGDVTEEPAEDPDTVVDPEPVGEPAADVYYQNCAAVRAAGAAPLNEGEPGYAPKLDRDRDGVACE